MPANPGLGLKYRHELPLLSYDHTTTKLSPSGAKRAPVPGAGVAVGPGVGAGVAVAGASGINVGVGVGAGVAVAAGVAVGAGVGVAVGAIVGVAVRPGFEPVTTRLTVDCTPPAVIFTCCRPFTSTGTAASTEKFPPASTKGAGKGRTEIPPMVKMEIGV